MTALSHFFFFMYALLCALHCAAIALIVLLILRFKGQVSRALRSYYVGAGLTVVNFVSYYCFVIKGFDSPTLYAALRVTAVALLIGYSILLTAPFYRFLSVGALVPAVVCGITALVISGSIHVLALSRRHLLMSLSDAIDQAHYSVLYAANILFFFLTQAYFVVRRRGDSKTGDMRKALPFHALVGAAFVALSTTLSLGRSFPPDYLLGDFVAGLPVALFAIVYAFRTLTATARTGRTTYFEILKRLRSFNVREAALLDLVLAGKANKAIAFELGLSEETIKKRLTGLFKRFGVTSRLELIRWLSSY